MQKGEECNGIAPEQYGGRKKHTPEVQALNQRTWYTQPALPMATQLTAMVKNYGVSCYLPHPNV
eukprot:4584211-Ditylum_brightwellii.AAC.1